jgi:hypothetical protein
MLKEMALDVDFDSSSLTTKSHRVTTIEWVNCMQILIEVGMCLIGHKSKRGLHKVWYKCW